MKTLKTEEGKKIVLCSFENSADFEFTQANYEINKVKILFSGTKTELLEKDDSFWKPLLQSWHYPSGWEYCFIDGIPKETAKESGISSLEGEHEFILITEESL